MLFQGQNTATNSHQKRVFPEGAGTVCSRPAVATVRTKILSAMLLEQVLQAALDARTNDQQNIVIDVCAGHCSWRSVAEKAGLVYVPVDIRF